MDASEKMYDQLVHTTSNHYPPKMDVLPKTFVQFILPAKWSVQHSSTSPKHRAGNWLIAHLLICSNRSGQMSECDCFAQVAQDKWGTVSDSLRSLRTNERLWAYHSGQMSNFEQITQIAHDKWANVSKSLRSFSTKEEMSESLTKHERFYEPMGKRWSFHFGSFRVTD